jgi:hypothetical protein
VRPAIPLELHGVTKLSDIAIVAEIQNEDLSRFHSVPRPQVAHGSGAERLREYGDIPGGDVPVVAEDEFRRRTLIRLPQLDAPPNLLRTMELRLATVRSQREREGGAIEMISGANVPPDVHGAMFPHPAGRCTTHDAVRGSSPAVLNNLCGITKWAPA